MPACPEGMMLKLAFPSIEVQGVAFSKKALGSNRGLSAFDRLMRDKCHPGSLVRS
jgi:hypothetical protein